jgi:hypothetical protein
MGWRVGPSSQFHTIRLSIIFGEFYVIHMQTELDLQQLYSKLLLPSIISDLTLRANANAGLLSVFSVYAAKWSITVAKCVLIMSSLGMHQLNKRGPISPMSPSSQFQTIRLPINFGEFYVLHMQLDLQLHSKFLLLSVISELALLAVAKSVLIMSSLGLHQLISSTMVASSSRGVEECNGRRV